VMPEIITLHGHILGHLGQVDAAAEHYARAIAIKPELLDAQETLARLLPQIGRASGALAGFEAALAAQPADRALAMSAALAARDVQDHGRLTDWSRQAITRFGPDPEFRLALAIGQKMGGQRVEAIDTLNALLADHPDFAGGHNHLAPLLIAEGAWKAAEHHALEGARLAPLDQSGWAWLSIIWRLLGDAREAWLADYDRLVMPMEIVLAPGLAGLLTTMHTTRHNPAEQSLRGGTQTRGLLFDRRLPEIQALKASIRDAVREALGKLAPDPAHPFLARLGADIGFAGSWSVQLKSEGFHISHIHPSGWLSSALYIALPPEVGPGDAGALAFGVPDAELGLDLVPRRIVTPQVGRLVIFPSYFWHGTIPFESESPRLTVAFDALPVDNRRPAV
jgi:tetratricopeptide (TPR) repeat protein